MRPITLECIYDVLSALREPSTFEEFLQRCGFTPGRAREVIRQVMDMGFVEFVGGRYSLTLSGKVFLKACEDGDNPALHELLIGYEPYRKLCDLLLSGKAFKVVELCRELRISAVAVDVLVRFMRKAGIRVVRNAAGEYYIERDSVEYYKFREAVLESYASLLARGKLPRPYVPIPELREAVKERLKICDEAFDKLFHTFVRENVGRVILTPAPFAIRRGRGIRLGRIEYYYVYIVSR